MAAALENLASDSKAPPNSFVIKTYTVHAATILGQGGFGVVFKGHDANKNPIAVKRIDAAKHPNVLSNDYGKLRRLVHRNVTRIFEVEQKDFLLWMFMELCELGDLNKFYSKRDIQTEITMKVVKQIVAGIEFLHSKDIIHRDIKPGNILVASENPVLVKLTDFDVTKDLDSDRKTSAMNSNVGTDAFKAPEFFKRNEARKIVYHRNVDVYAAGLTFLAILQHNKESMKLVPKIETPQDGESMFIPIGQIIAERIKYNKKPLDVMRSDRGQRNTDADDSSRTEMRKLVRKMTHYNPKNRPSSTKVMETLRKMKLQIRKCSSFDLEGDNYGVAVTSKNNIILTGTDSEGVNVIKILDLTGTIQKSMEPMCHDVKSDHYLFQRVLELPQCQGQILQSCARCDEIRAYNISSGECHLVCRGCKAWAVSTGPDESILVLDSKSKLSELKWNEKAQRLEKSPSTDLNMSNVNDKNFCTRMCYLRRNDLCVLASIQNHCVSAVKRLDGAVKWSKESEAVAGLTRDDTGRVFVCSESGTLRVIDSLDGELLQEITLDEVDGIWNIYWANEQLTVLHDHGQKITVFNVV